MGKQSRSRKRSSAVSRQWEVVLTLSCEDVERWQKVARTHGLDTLSSTALFLLKRYEENLLSQTNPDQHCGNCGASLQLLCPFCICKKLSSDSKSPSSTTSPPPPQLSQTATLRDDAPRDSSILQRSSHPQSSSSLESPLFSCIPASSSSLSRGDVKKEQEDKAIFGLEGQENSDQGVKIDSQSDESSGQGIITPDTVAENTFEVDEEVPKNDHDSESLGMVPDDASDEVLDDDDGMETGGTPTGQSDAESEREHPPGRQDNGATVKEGTQLHLLHFSCEAADSEPMETKQQCSSQRSRNKFSCSVCQLTFPHASSLIVHQKKQHEKNPLWKCRFCPANFGQPSELTAHLKTHPGKGIYACPQRRKGSRQSSHLAKEGEKPFLCQECGSSFSSSGNLKLHQRRHSGEKPYVCGECGKGYPLRRSLVEHQRSHSGEKPFLCQQCGAAFSFLSVLANHVNSVHVRPSSHACKACGETFAQLDGLLAHNRSAHTHDRPHHCQICGATFTKVTSLTYHRRVHTGEKPYRCELCPAVFTLSCHLIVHMRTHRGERRHRCDQCQKMFSTAGNLRVHQRSHTGEKPFACETCGTSYTQKRSLMVHLMKKHPS